MEALQACATESECATAHIALMACIAGVVCPAEADAFSAMRGATADVKAAEEAGRRYAEMEGCVTEWGRRAAGAGAQ